MHVGLQPSVPFVFPSSHCSLPSTNPSPHIVDVHGLPGSWQAWPGSSWHAELQPSVLFVFPSSHCSPPSTTVSPHTVRRQPAAAQTQPVSKVQFVLQPSPDS